MTIDPRTESLATAWRGQPMEHTPMSLEEIQANVRKAQDRSKRNLALAAIVVALGLFVAGTEWRAVPTPLMRIGVALMAIGWVAVLAGAYRSVSSAPANDSAQACANFLRERLRRALRTAQGGWLVLALPLLPGVAVLLLALSRNPAADAAHFAPIGLLGATWLIAMLVIQRRAAGRLRREIAELDAQMTE
ncbi:hypothetical protein [Caulobacter sp. LARHSG274]